MTYRIDLEPCINCGLCRRACPTDCIHFFTTHRRTHVIDPSGCIDCGLCAKVCPVNCIGHDPVYVHIPEELETAKAQARAWARKRHELQLRQREAAHAVARRLAARSA
jgi:formate hydrogenlyase subunit 6/NADH:ubiquinone oxidoreductase subunit I